MIGTYSKRGEKIYKILKLLALNGQLYQKDLSRLVGTSYRNLIRQLQLLRNGGLIRVARTEPSSKKGRDKNVWELTVMGLIEVIKRLNEFKDESEFDAIAKAQRDKSVVFQEWEFLAKDPEIKKHVLLGMGLFVRDKTTGIVIAKHVEKSKPKEKEAFLASFEMMDYFLGIGLSKAALHLDMIFDYGAVPPWLHKPEAEDHPLVILWRACASNPRLRSFIEWLFEEEEIRHKTILDFKKWLYQKT